MCMLQGVRLAWLWPNGVFVQFQHCLIVMLYVYANGIRYVPARSHRKIHSKHAASSKLAQSRGDC